MEIKQTPEMLQIVDTSRTGVSRTVDGSKLREQLAVYTELRSRAATYLREHQELRLFIDGIVSDDYELVHFASVAS